MNRTILALRLIPVVVAWAVSAAGLAQAATYVVDQAAPGVADTNSGTEQGIELGDKEEVRIAEITVTNTLQEAKAN